jgi:hypothetical protein
VIWWAALSDGGAYTLRGDKQLVTEGNAPLIAAMRGYVASKLGDEVELPEELA